MKTNNFSSAEDAVKFAAQTIDEILCWRFARMLHSKDSKNYTLTINELKEMFTPQAKHIFNERFGRYCCTFSAQNESLFRAIDAATTLYVNSKQMHLKLKAFEASQFNLYGKRNTVYKTGKTFSHQSFVVAPAELLDTLAKDETWCDISDKSHFSKRTYDLVNRYIISKKSKEQQLLHNCKTTYEEMLKAAAKCQQSFDDAADFTKNNYPGRFGDNIMKKTQAQRDVIARFNAISKELLKEFSTALEAAAEADEEASEQPDEKPRSEMTLAERQEADVAARKAEIEEQSVVQSESTIEFDDGKPTEVESKLIEFFTESVHKGLVDVQSANRLCDELNIRCRFTSKDQPRGFAVSKKSLQLNEIIRRKMPEWKKALQK